MAAKKKALLGLSVLALFVLVDFKIADNAHRKIIGNAAGFSQRYQAVDLDWDGPEKQGCEVRRVYLVNAYQTCFVAWYGKPGEGIQGFTYVYHRPRPILLFYGQTPSSRYFRYAEYGIRLKQVLEDGFVNHLY